MEACRNCGGKLVVKPTKKTAEQLKKAYYYTAYYWCPSCKKLYHDERFKVTSAASHPELVSGSLDSRFRGNDEGESGNDEGDSTATLQNDKIVEIWTDGACVNNGKPNARAAWAFVSEDTEKAGLVIGKQTNNTAEAFAIYHALVWAAEKGFKKIKLHTDSQISLHGVNKHHSKVKVNREIFENIANVIDKNNLQIEYVKVLGHSGDVNNDRVDKLANELVKNNGF